MDIISLIIGMKLGGGGFPLGDIVSEYNFNDLNLEWDNTAEENE